MGPRCLIDRGHLVAAADARRAPRSNKRPRPCRAAPWRARASMAWHVHPRKPRTKHGAWLASCAASPPPDAPWLAQRKYPTSCHELHAFLTGKIASIDLQCAGELGLDSFFYSLTMRPVPTQDMVLHLKERFTTLLHVLGADGLAKAIRINGLLRVLGRGFEWVCPAVLVTKGTLAPKTGWPIPAPCKERGIPYTSS